MKRFILCLKRPRAWLRAILLAGLLLCFTPLSSMAQTIGVPPPVQLDFGQVKIGTTEQRTLVLANTDTISPLSITSIVNIYDPFHNFVLSPAVPPIVLLLPGEKLEVIISFTPSQISDTSASLAIQSNSVNLPYIEYYVFGRGIEDNPCTLPEVNCDDECIDVSSDLNNCGSCYNECVAPANAKAVCISGLCGFVCDEGYEQVGDGCAPIVPQPPLEMLENLIGFVDTSIEDGYLLGFGPGGRGDQSAFVRLRKFYDVLNKSYTELSEGSPGKACNQLNWLQLRCDGGWPFVLPPDFVMGEARGSVHEGLVKIINALDDCALEKAITPPQNGHD